MPRITYQGTPNLLGSGFNVSLIGSSFFSSKVINAPDSRKPRLLRYRQQHADRHVMTCQGINQRVGQTSQQRAYQPAADHGQSAGTIRCERQPAPNNQPDKPHARKRNSQRQDRGAQRCEVAGAAGNIATLRNASVPPRPNSKKR